MKFPAVLVAGGVEPTLFGDPDRIHDKRSAFPMPYGMAHEFRVFHDVLRVRPYIGVRHPVDCLVLEQKSNHVRGLDELKREGRCKSARWTDGKTAGRGIVFGVDAFPALHAVSRVRRFMSKS